MYQTLSPVVLIIFNRPKLSRQVLDAIAIVRPKELYVIADGPRTGYVEDLEKCKLTRSLIDRIDWDCHIFKNFSEHNLGCKKRIYTGLNWVFKHTKKAIILEDDCLPDPTFFQFCDELLNRYINDERIVTISGNNFQFGRQRTMDSYYFSRYSHCWGWATWERAWKNCDVSMSAWPKVRQQKWLIHILKDALAARYWTYKFQQTYSGEINSWAYPWLLSCWLQNGLSILPNKNLVSNIGFDAEGTHHRNSRNPFANLPTFPMEFPLQHPEFVVRNGPADDFTQTNQFGFWSRSRRKFRSLLKL